MKQELIFECTEAQYDLYTFLSQYFEVEKLRAQDDTMGVIDGIKVFIEPISQTIETIGNIIVAFINSHRCTITVKNGEKEVSFEGQVGRLSNEEIISILNKVFAEE